MEWAEALSFDEIITSVSREWAHRVGDQSIIEDLYQEIIMGLVTSVDLSKATKDPAVYVKAICWKMAYKYTKRNGWNFESLDFLEDSRHMQVDQDKNIIRPQGRNIHSVDGDIEDLLHGHG